MYDAIIHKTICKTNQQAGKKAFCGHDKRRKIMLPSSLYISSIMLPLYMNNIKDCLRKVYRLLILNVYII